MYGECILAPEVNAVGFATLSVLKDIYSNIYVRESKENIGETVTTKYGFRTTRGNKTDILYRLRTAVEDGDLLILDKDVLLEMKYYTKQHLRARGAEEGMTQHFDLLMATAIAWEMEENSRAKTVKKKFKQPEYTPLSSYQSRG
jgi:hypothetical protein